MIPLPGIIVLAQDFNPKVMSLYDAWNRFNPAGSSQADELENSSGSDSARAAIARGQALFNSKPIRISNVKGLNDDTQHEHYRGYMYHLS